jgi:hypothetical protein
MVQGTACVNKHLTRNSKDAVERCSTNGKHGGDVGDDNGGEGELNGD